MASQTPSDQIQSSQAAGGSLQVNTIPLGGSNLDVEARLPINGYWAVPGQEITYDASSSMGTIGTYEWDLDGDGTFDKTTTSPVLKHVYPATFEGQMILRVSSPLGSTNVLKTPVHIGSVGPWGVRPARPATVKAEVVSADGTHVKLTWESDDPTAASWAVAVNGVPVGRIEKSARSVTVTDIRRGKDVLLEIFGITADGKVGERAGTTLPAAK
ncbi:PKD domain-containing protein [Arthrobacter sp. MW3 TE3886]|uniref:PKD domain-containing protein n=1 Tax=Arthrobacter sp. MW3 TE3886 TaxID=3156254 RepID=UPI003517F31E